MDKNALLLWAEMVLEALWAALGLFESESFRVSALPWYPRLFYRSIANKVSNTILQ
jgi:hypothetical protein